MLRLVLPAKRRAGAPFVLAAVLTAFNFAASAAAQQLRCIVPPAGDPAEQPPLRTLVLSREKPEDVTEAAAYRGTSRVAALDMSPVPKLPASRNSQRRLT